MSGYDQDIAGALTGIEWAVKVLALKAERDSLLPTDVMRRGVLNAAIERLNNLIIRDE